MDKRDEHLLPMLKLIVEDKGRPVEYSGSGRDKSVPMPTAKRLAGLGLIERQGSNWIATQAGRNAVGWT